MESFGLICSDTKVKDLSIMRFLLTDCMNTVDIKIIFQQRIFSNERGMKMLETSKEVLDTLNETTIVYS